MDARALLRDIAADRDYRGQIVHVREIAAREAVYGECRRAALPRPLWSLLRRGGIERLYGHQAAAIDAIAAGEDVVIVTGTASGKTLCYNAAVVSALLEAPNSRAMYVFPTKALTQDQFGLLQR